MPEQKKKHWSVQVKGSFLYYRSIKLSETTPPSVAYQCFN